MKTASQRSPRWFRVMPCVLALLVAEAGYAASADSRLDLDALDRRIEALQVKVQQVEKNHQQAASSLADLESRIVLRGRAYYRLSRRDHGGNFMDHAVRLERLRQGLVSDQEKLATLKRVRDSSGETRALLAQKLRPLMLEREAAGRARDALLAQSERERAFQQAFAPSSARPDHTAVYSANSTLEYAGESFAALRGRLPFPLSGRSEVEKAVRPNGQGPGLFFRAALGTPVRSVFAGKVVFADEHADYERTVIIDHGEGYFTVTAGLGAFDVKSGDEVAAGSRIGSLKNAGAMSGVYIEVRRHQEILPPVEWFGL